VAAALPAAPRALVERLAAQGAGNAFYLEELAHAAADGRAEELPGSVLAMAMARLETLDDTARRALRAASVFGEVFTPAGAARLLGRPDDEVAPLFAGLVARGWLVASPGEPLRFRHALLHEAAYATLTDEDRRLGHRLAAAWLEAQGGEDAARLALHHARGGDRARASTWYRRAAERALAASDLAGALALAHEAESSGAQGTALGEVRLIEAWARHWLAQHDGALEAALEAARLLPPLGSSWYRALDALAEASLPLGEVATLEALASALEPPPAALEPDDDARLAFLDTAATVSQQLALGGRHDPAQLAMARLEAELTARHDLPPLTWARAEFARTTHAVTRGDLGEMIVHARAAIASYETAGDQRSAALMTTNLAWALAEMGAFDEAEPQLRAAAATAERMNIAFLLGAVRNNLALVLARRGELAAARAAADEALRLYRGADNRRVEGMVHIYRAMIDLASRQLARAEREARRAVEVTAPFPPTHAHAQAMLAQVLLARGQAGEAARVAGEANAALVALGTIDEGEALVRLVHAEALHAAGLHAEARAAIGEAAAVLRARAARISDESWRASFLARVPENARTLALAAAWDQAAAAAR
jgi:tetratricopeptide (TPR) repeat protein